MNNKLGLLIKIFVIANLFIWHNTDIWNNENATVVHIPIEQAREDITTFTNSIIGLHPTMQNSENREVFLNQSELLKQELNSFITKTELYMNLSKLMVQLEDSHTTLKFESSSVLPISFK
ncbi:hypothetical protein LC087_13400 [Bacillus carboniphilus]|uniref:Uncharacterized protein n=1 Tax=Bacillus carboniphilus TaxID=86663 RepID=A0ABY9JR14_9BACI|nr:hypothetical protein [Bacillus carboniphilus]WLR41831.1 hypothetical protein LC087_13400 [Bacillus carboniphilus]